MRRRHAPARRWNGGGDKWPQRRKRIVMSKLQIMQSWRYLGGSTTDNCSNLCNLIARPGWTVHLYASPTQGTEEDDQHSGPSTNFPLLVALATEDLLPSIARYAIVMDGLLLTAARPPRDSEIRAVLDAALEQEPGKVRVAFGGDDARAPFTAGMPFELAAARLAAIPTTPLTASNRPRFWQMLSLMTEAEHFARFNK